jgi:hypothetical protein
MSQGAVGRIHPGFVSIGLFGNPAFAGRISMVTNMPTHTAHLKDRNVRGHLRSSFFYRVVLVMTFLTMRFKIPNEFTSTKQYGFALLFGKALIVGSIFTHSLKGAYELSDERR